MAKLKVADVFYVWGETNYDRMTGNKCYRVMDMTETHYSLMQVRGKNYNFSKDPWMTARKIFTHPIDKIDMCVAGYYDGVKDFFEIV